jgi:hypothetical protein
MGLPWCDIPTTTAMKTVMEQLCKTLFIMPSHRP